MDPADSDNTDEYKNQGANDEPHNSSEELSSLNEYDEKPYMSEKSLYLEHPDVQRQLNQYSSMAQAGAVSNVEMESSLLHCEVCNFTTGHLSSMRRHYMNRHGKKILRCKDCNFFTGLRKTLEMHMEMGHLTCPSEPTHEKDLQCPFCLYQTKNKNNMIDHIVLHREERVVPMEVRRPKLSRYLQGLVFRCHKCTFTSGSPENLRLHMMKHDEIRPYKCRLCYFDCTHLSTLEAHLSDKHQVLRNHELVGQINLDQHEARVDRKPEQEEELLSVNDHPIDRGDVVKESVTDLDDFPQKTQSECLAENYIRENVITKLKEVLRKGQVGKSRNGENSAKKEQKKTMVQINLDQGQPEQAETLFLPDAARGNGRDNVSEKHYSEGNNAVIKFEDCSSPEKDMQMSENPARHEVRGRDVSRVTFTPQPEETAKGISAASDTFSEEPQDHKLHLRVVEHRSLNIDDKREDNILGQVLQLDEEENILMVCKKSDCDKTVKIEENIGPTCRQPKLNHEGILGTSPVDCKEKLQTQKNSLDEGVGHCEIPELKTECLNEELYSLSGSEAEDQDDHLEQKQEQDKVITEDDKNQGSHLEHQETDRMKEALVTDGVTAEGNRFTCQYCGRKLLNSAELERHIIRHGM
ncbi:RE1-silencing transcription factor-like [Antennarius striatus]|uniref:RE1-silencing transcription factor-like n=1 Tax=Antennarius striatus TaxID=241820 RepID=UPI0035B1C5F8